MYIFLMSDFSCIQLYPFGPSSNDEKIGHYFYSRYVLSENFVFYGASTRVLYVS